MAKDYFIIEHEGHIQPVPDHEMHMGHPDYMRFVGGIGNLMRTIGHDISRMMEDAATQSDAPKLPQPEASIKQMDEAGVDVCMLVPHWHALHMNVEPKGTPNEWVIEQCERFPDRLMPGPVFRPSIVGVEESVREMEYLVTEKGVKYAKIYPPGEKWNMDDERYFPFYARAEELGLVLAFHTGHGYIYGANTEAGNPRHLEEVCRNFFDLKILAFHMGWPWHHDLNCIAMAYPNLYVGLSWLNNTVNFRPRFFGKLLGEAIMYAGIDKVIWSNDGIAQKPMVDGFRDFQFPQDLQDGYGFKALTTEDKAKMFGLNFAKLIGIEPTKRCD